MNINNPLTIVSGYWKITNKHGNNFDKWFKNTLSINCPYVFFSDKETIEIIKTYRKELPTYYIECNIEDFHTYKYKDRMIIDNYHCPSVELNLIWNEKAFLVKKALEVNPFDSEFFCWVDAGICIYRDKKPPNIQFPSIEKLNKLPKDKFIYSSSRDKNYNNKFINDNMLHHHVSGTSYILHKNIIKKFCICYESYLEKHVNKDQIWTDQIILTHMYSEQPHMFYKLADGYGEIIPKLY